MNKVQGRQKKTNKIKNKYKITGLQSSVTLCINSYLALYEEKYRTSRSRRPAESPTALRTSDHKEEIAGIRPIWTHSVTPLRCVLPNIKHTANVATRYELKQ